MELSLGCARTCLHYGLTVAVLSIVIVVPGQVCSACTIVVKADQNSILVGNNEDYLEPRTKIWFFPAGERIHGRVIWGYDRALWPYQGGMNDRGLFLDINAVGFTGYKDDPDKPDLPGDAIEYILTRCATVDEVVQVFERYDIGLGYVQFVFADAAGKSAIIEWLKGRLNVIDRTGDYQVSTNFTSPMDHFDPRNRVAVKVLNSQKEATIDLIRRALSASAVGGPYTQTLYSTICDLKKRKVLLYHFHNFEESVAFDLGEQLGKGEASYAIPSLFDIRPYYENFFLSSGSQLGAMRLLEFIDANGAEKGITRFHEMAAETKSYHRYVFEEWIIRDVGMILLARGKIQDAVAIFQLNTRQYPKSWEAYYDLAEAYMKLGDSGAANLNYQLALKHEPDAARAADIRKKLEAARK